MTNNYHTDPPSLPPLTPLIPPLEWKERIIGFTFAATLTFVTVITIHGWIEVLPKYWPF